MTRDYQKSIMVTADRIVTNSYIKFRPASFKGFFYLFTALTVTLVSKS